MTQAYSTPFAMPTTSTPAGATGAGAGRYFARRRQQTAPAGYETPPVTATADPAAQPQASASPARPAHSDMFFRSVAMNNANRANDAANFASNAPMPTDPTAAAARKTFIESHRARADQFAGNFFQDRQLAQSANDRADLATGSQAGYLDSEAGVNHAAADRTRTMAPAEARSIDATAGRTRAETNQVTAMIPGQVESQRLDNQGRAIGNQFLPPHFQNSVDAGRIENEGGQIKNRFLPPTFQAALDHEKAQTQQILHPPADPQATLDLQQGQYAFQQKVLEDQRAGKPIPPGFSAPPTAGMTAGQAAGPSMMAQAAAGGGGGGIPTGNAMAGAPAAIAPAAATGSKGQAPTPVILELFKKHGVNNKDAVRRDLQAMGYSF